MSRCIDFLCLSWLALLAPLCHGQSLPAAISGDRAFERELAESEGIEACTNAAGHIVALTVHGKQAGDELLLRLREIPTLEALNLQVTSSNAVSAHGIAALTNLTSLQIACAGSFSATAFRETCGLTNLRRLVLVATFPPAGEYSSLSKLKNLHSLEISFATNFTDADLPVITNLTVLTNLSLKWTGVSGSGTNVLSSLANLSRVELKLR
jgi:hypothetical protein